MNRRKWLGLLGCVSLMPRLAWAEEAASTWHQRRFRNMVEQNLDMSCGAASMSALLNFYANIPIGEAGLLGLLANVVSEKEQDAVIRDGFTLLHLKKAVANLGLELKAANTYNAQLVRFASPALLQLKTRQGFHFVLWHGKVKGRHWLGDPSRGDLWLSDHELEREWTGVASWLFREGKRLPQATQQQLEAAYSKR